MSEPYSLDLGPAADVSRESVQLHRAPLFLLYINVLIVASCGLVYELLAGTLASYVLGDSVTQFSLVIGVYLSALGIGAWISGFVTRRLARVFIEVELAVALVGGCSAPILFLAYGYVRHFHLALFGFVLGIGTLVGLELPLLMRILREHVEFKELVARVLAFDYIGALVASLLFPLFLVPQLGLVRTSFVVGLLNSLVALWGTSILSPLLQGSLTGLRCRGLVVIGILITGIAKTDLLTAWAEERQFSNPIVFARTSPYQRIVITRSSRDFQLFLNGNLQFHSADEYRYHEALVHPAFSAAASRQRILVLGGGDGLAVREILRYGEVRQITLVDIDPAMTEIGRTFPLLRELNESSLEDRRVTIVNDDAYIWLDNSSEVFDVVVIDFPDPSTFSVGKLYTTIFYRKLAQRLAPGATVAIQCTSPLNAPKSYWCIAKTLEQSGYQVLPYRTTVPSFGEWGFLLAAKAPFPRPEKLLLSDPGRARLRYLDHEQLARLFEFPPDMARQPVEANRWHNQILVRYYEAEWSRWN